MLLGLFDRLWTPTALYFILALPLCALRHVANNTIAYAALGAWTAYYAQNIVTAVLCERKIDALGGRAPSRRTWTPYNLGMLSDLIWYVSRHRVHEWWWKLFQRPGEESRYTVESIIMGARMIFTADEENIKAILASQFQDSGKGPQFRIEWKDFLGLSIFTTDGERWHQSRQLLRPQFIKDRVSDLHTFEKHTQILIRLLAGSHDGETVRADDLFYRFTLDAATDFLLGKSVDSLENGQTEFAQAFADVQNVQSLIARLGPIRALIPKGKFRAGLKVINRFVGNYIDRALQLSPEELEKITKSDEGYTFLHALASYTRDRDVLRDQLVAVLLAGRDTTAVTLSWLFYELSRHPQVVQKLRQEIFSFVGPEQQPTYDDLKSMRYLQHTLNEILRLYPVVPYNVRQALRDTTLPRGGGPNGDEPIGIPKDTAIGYSTLVLQGRPDIYPSRGSGFPDHLAFVPERWDAWTPKSWTYIPFNGGPRICIGQQFALTEMAYTVVRTLQTFERVECRMDEFPMMRTDIVLQPAKGVDIAFLRREKQ
ncbi:hypothetical protein LTR91_004913 [Friedmanniomyces endolithicus]|uniref:Cytochrome P450 52A13 n=1 Tax=Friedmanniomyces endolithicus TaxID=329885 RepID=A0AAN6QYE0_9PEZI|nr:hypothetical protein LTR57_007927 [Friedmanniomyces endolithicus]KAK1002771.1 hypothetical protein LTR91_004913 [Friedmanniomyces endolithicus]KAK1008897.1 hypothetical protein LTS01_002170 [Friedmanniomyces endolithicus]KAK1037015.1 hypothetical protein LTS16_013281 [Friedmanniomyces endolithicus]